MNSSVSVFSSCTELCVNPENVGSQDGVISHCLLLDLPVDSLLLRTVKGELVSQYYSVRFVYIICMICRPDVCVDTRLAQVTQDSSKLVLVLCQCPSAKVCFARLHLRDRHILPVTTADLCGHTVVPALRSQSVLLSCVRHNQKTTWHLHPMHKVQHK
jgi:hypothetical protein